MRETGLGFQKALGSVLRALDRGESARLAAKVEEVVKRVVVRGIAQVLNERIRVRPLGRANGSESVPLLSENVFAEFQDAAEIMAVKVGAGRVISRARNVSSLGVRRDNQQRHAKAVHVLAAIPAASGITRTSAADRCDRIDVVVEASPVVPGNQNGGIGPTRESNSPSSVITGIQQARAV